MEQQFQPHLMTPDQAEIVALRQRLADLEQQLAGADSSIATCFTLFEQHRAVILLIDPQTGAIVAANLAASQFYGYPQELLQHMQLSDLTIPPPDQPELPPLLNGEPGCFQIRQQHAAGEIYDVEIAIGPLNLHGRSLLCAIVRDVSTHRRVEAALRESEERFRTVADWTYDWEYWIDPSGKYRYVSPACERITGYRPEEFMADPTFFKRIVHPDDQAYVSRHQHASVEQQEAGEMIFRIITRSGEERWISHACQPVYAADGRWLGQRASNRDITSRMRTEAALRQSEERYHTLMQNALQASEARYYRLTENAADIIYCLQLHPTPRFEYVSPAVKRITGYTPEEHYADPGLGFKLVYPEDQPLLAAITRGEIPSGTPVELRWMHKDGSIVWVEQRNILVYDDADRLVSIEGIARDVTLRKQTEQALELERNHSEALVIARTRELRQERDRTRAILEALGEAVIVVDLEGRIQYLNPAAVALVSFPSEKTIAEQHWCKWQQLVPYETIDQIQRTLQAGQTWRGEVTLKRIDGTCYDAALTVAPLVDPEAPEQPVGFVSVQRDITGMKAAERLKDQFVSNVSHELRSPMSLITMLTGSLELLYPRLDDARRLAIIGNIRKHAQVLSDLINDVLEISRIDSGRLATEQQILNLAHLASDEVANLLPIAHKKALTLAVDIDEELPVLGHEGQVRQVLRNLLNNAIKYTPDGGTITCTCRTITAPVPASVSRKRGGKPAIWPGSNKLPPGRWVACGVADTGIGISSADLPHLYERFYRAQTQGDIPGTGLGLSIAWELVKHHAGYLEVSSIPDVGSSFAMYLPLKEEPRDN